MPVSPTIHLMQSSFSPEEFIDFYEIPFDPLENIQDAEKDLEPVLPWSSDNLSEVDVSEIKWHDYKPPAALRRAPHITSQILHDIIYSSIENVKTRASEKHRIEVEEEQRKKENDAKNLDKDKEKPQHPILILEEASSSVDMVQDENNAKKLDKGKGKVLYRPINIPGDESVPLDNDQNEDDAGKVDKGKRKESFSPITAPDDVSVSVESVQTEDDPKKLDKGKGKEPYHPSIVSDESESVGSVQNDDDTSPRHSSATQTPTSSILTDAGAKPEKRRMFALRKFFQRSDKKGESSSTGSAIEIIRKIYERKSGDEPMIAPDPEPEPVEELVECVSCLDDFSPKEMIKVPCHSYCCDCFVRLVSAAVQNEQQWPPTCCLNPIPVQTILQIIPSDLRKTFQDRSQEWDIPVADRVYCSYQGCSLWIRPTDINPGQRQGVCADQHVTCTICRGAGHQGEECGNDPDMALTNHLAEEEGWKRCFNCHALVEHSDACQHMTCRCGTQFCYVCGLVWRTCDCTIEHLIDLKTTAELRREERRFMQQADSEDLRQILLQIEEFEREEALKNEIRRQEQERRDEERRQRELEERVLQESFRCREIELKYQELRAVMNQLHELQLVLFDVDQEEMGEQLAIEAMAAKEELFKEQDAERSDLDSLLMAKLADKEYTLDKEFQIRAAEENDIEQEYHEKLKEYWKDKKDGSKKIETSMFLLRKLMDQRHRAWQKWKKDALEEFEDSLEEDRTMKEESMYSAKSKLDDLYGEKGKELERQKAAERKWLEMIIVEREKLLNEWEVQELEGDADNVLLESLTMAERMEFQQLHATA